MFEKKKKKCHGYSEETQLTALCWALASIYQTLLNIMQHPQGEERENIPTDTMDKRDTVSVTPITKKKKWKWDRERRSSYRKGLLCSSYTLCQRIRAGTVKYRLDFFRATCPA